MASNLDKPRPLSFTAWVATEPLALFFGVVAIAVLGVALGVCISIMANALR
jgi:hypothetical protein